ncbi:MAG: NAD(P)-dependent oxidoreductase [Betaproteobacteria bacterium]|nr:NAD(P)-dependent oxidoreductase [Betaproteobacteria bacterium]
MNLGYVGVGLMGLPMTKHLLSKGHSVAAYDIVAERVEAAEALGARSASSPADVCRGAEIVLLNLPTPYAVEAAVFGEGGVASALKPPQLLVDFSTIKVEQGRDFSARLKAQTGCGWVDAPVSGGPPASGSGALTVMAGGEPGDIERIRPLMKDVAARFTAMGPPGSGLVAKMINQLIVGCGHAVMAEAIVLAEAAGIDPARIPECLAGGYADGALLQRLYPRMARRDFAPQGYARQLLKDLEMVNELAGSMKAPVPMMGEALSLYRMLVHLGYSELDSGAILKLYEREGKK